MPPSLRLGALLSLLLLPLTAFGAANLTKLVVGPISADAAAALTTPEPVGASDQPAVPPPSPLFGDELVRSAQAHLLGATQSGPRELTVLAYHAITKTWAEFGKATLPGEPVALRPAPGGFLVETRGGTDPTRIELVVARRLLHAVDWLVIVVYLLGTAGIGLYFYLRKEKRTTANFFVGGRSIPWWAAGVSLYATGTSAISFIAIPAKSFATDWLYLAGNVVGLFGTIFIAIWVVPLIRRLDLMSVFHYLELRFHPKIRAISSALAITLQLGGRMSIVLYLPSLAMATVTGLDVSHSIIIMGIVTIVYTVMGGMKAVIWTDFIQVFVMLGGAFFAIFYVIKSLDGGFGEFLGTAVADNKLRTFDWSFDLTKATVWGFVLYVILGDRGILTYPQDQVMMQRVLSTKSDREAGWSVWTLAAIVVPGSITFFAIGTALYAFYKHHPERLNPLLSVDSTFPLFIAAELPVGITGLLIAGIFAASMSTLSSCINSVATLVSVDFYERYAKSPTSGGSVRLAGWMTIIGGMIGIGTALLLAAIDIKSALDKSFELLALLGGGFAGCYALGMFTLRANWQGAAIGVGVSLVVTFIAWILQLVHPYFYIVIAVTACIVAGFLASLFFPAPAQSLQGLTVFTPKKNA